MGQYGFHAKTYCPEALWHPNIRSPSKILSVRNSNGESVLVGHLSTFFTRGDLGTVIAAANSTGTQISLKQKAKWCH